jgi:hypothetical protein
MEDAMATRKTASKTAARTTGKAQDKPAAAATRRPAASAPKKPPATPVARSAPVMPAPVRAAKAPARPAEAPTGEARYRWIAHAAYLRAEKRGFAPGQEVDDWLAAEADFIAAFATG